MNDLRFFSPNLLSIGLFGVSVATIGTLVSIVAGVLGIIYTGLKIYDWYRENFKKKTK